MYKLGYIVGAFINTSFYALFGYDLWRNFHSGRSFAIDVIGVVSLLFFKQLLLEIKVIANATEFLALSMPKYTPPKNTLDDLFNDITKDI